MYDGWWFVGTQDHCLDKTMRKTLIAALAATTLFTSTTVNANPVFVSNPVVQKVDIKEEITPPVKTPANKNDEEQIRCMARNAYFEARGESKAGRYAVNNVVMNRVKHGKFPNSPCGVVKQRYKNTCQFSWVCKGTGKINNPVLYAEMLKIASDVYFRRVSDNTHNAIYFHSSRIKPKWSNVLARTVRIGAHIFYKG